MEAQPADETAARINAKLDAILTKAGRLQATLADLPTLNDLYSPPSRGLWLFASDNPFITFLIAFFLIAGVADVVETGFSAFARFSHGCPVRAGATP